MKEPRHRPGPDFEKATEPQEQERQQRIAALTDTQRKDYTALEREHHTQEQNLRNTLDRDHARKLPDRMRALLSSEPQPHLKPHGPNKAPDERQLKRMRHAVDDYLAGNKTRDTNAYAHQLQNAEKKANDEFKRETNTKLKSLRQEHQMDRDQFLDRAGKDRSAEQTKAEFDKSAKDPTWQRAVQMAASQEADKDKELKLAKEFGKAR